MAKLLLVPLCFLCLIAGSLAVIGRDSCEYKDGCAKCAKTYTIGDTYLAKPMGCYLSKGNENGNVLPYGSLINENSKVNKDMWNEAGDAAQLIEHMCGDHAIKKNPMPKYFGIEYTGECYFGDEIKGQGFVPAKDCAVKCEWDVGSADTMMVFEIVEKQKRK